MHELINLAKKKQMINVCIPFLGRFRITNSYPTIKYTEKTTSWTINISFLQKNFVKCLMVIDFNKKSRNFVIYMYKMAH